MFRNTTTFDDSKDVEQHSTRRRVSTTKVGRK